jgi:hypothetical protein
MELGRSSSAVIGQVPLRDRTQEWRRHIIDVLLPTRPEDFEDTLTSYLVGPEHAGLLKTTFVDAIRMYATQARFISTQSAGPKTELSTSASSGEQGRGWSLVSWLRSFQVLAGGT